MTIRYDFRAMEATAFGRGLNHTAVAKKARLAQSTVTRFFAGRNQSPKTAKKIAGVIGRDLRDFVLNEQAAAS